VFVVVVAGVVVGTAPPFATTAAVAVGSSPKPGKCMFHVRAKYS